MTPEWRTFAFCPMGAINPVLVDDGNGILVGISRKSVGRFQVELSVEVEILWSAATVHLAVDMPDRRARVISPPRPTSSFEMATEVDVRWMNKGWTVEDIAANVRNVVRVLIAVR